MGESSGSAHTTAFLLHRIRDGDAAARAALVARVGPLLQRFARIHDVLLPAWRQAALAAQAATGAVRAGQVAALHAQIDDEVAAAQARLR